MAFQAQTIQFAIQQVETLADRPTASALTLGVLCHVRDSSTTYLCRIAYSGSTPTGLEWVPIPGQITTGFRRVWTLTFQTITDSSGLPHPKLRNQLVPLTSFKADRDVIDAVLEVDLLGNGTWQTLVYNVDWKFMPRVADPASYATTPVSRPPAAGGPPVTVADYATGFAVMDAAPIVALLVPGTSQFRFSWTEWRLAMKPEGIAPCRVLNAGGQEPDANPGGGPFFIAATSPKPGQTSVQFRRANAVIVSPLLGTTVEFWRRTVAHSRSRDPNPGVDPFDLKRLGSVFVPYFRGPATTSGDPWLFVEPEFCPTRSDRQYFKVCYYDPISGARSELSNETVVVNGVYNETISPGFIYRAGRHVFVMG